MLSTVSTPSPYLFQVFLSDAYLPTPEPQLLMLQLRATGLRELLDTNCFPSLLRLGLDM